MTVTLPLLAPALARLTALLPLTLLLLATATHAQAQMDGRNEPDARLPAPYAAALRAANVPTSAVGVWVSPLDNGPLSLAVNASTPMNPASTMKLVTTYVALNVLGPAYTWRTEAFVNGALRRDALEGQLILRGSGDPKLVVEYLWLLVQRIRGYGIREIRGDVVVDKSAFDPAHGEAPPFDADVLRPYNAGPDALLVNYKAVTFGFVPDPEARMARVVVLPALAGLKVPPFVRAVDGPCGDWRGRLQSDFSNPMAPVFRGAYPLSCGERLWHVNVLNHNQYFGALFRALWEGAGGTWVGTLREGGVPVEARRIAVHESPPLAEIIRDINKNSNNVMTRQLYLSLGAEASQQPATLERANATVRAWLANRGLEMPELVIENGSGLSRAERIAPASLARLLTHAYASPLMPEFVSSLPLVGVDGTMKNRTGAAGSAHIKSGLLNDVRAVAGYVHAMSGRRYVVVGLINHPNARDAQGAQDALLEWVYRNG